MNPSILCYIHQKHEILSLLLNTYSSCFGTQTCYSLLALYFVFLENLVFWHIRQKPEILSLLSNIQGILGHKLVIAY